MARLLGPDGKPLLREAITANAGDVWSTRFKVTAPIPGPIQDWPADIQDAVYEAIDAQCHPRLGWCLKVVTSWCDMVTPTEPVMVVDVMEVPHDVDYLARQMARARRERKQ